MNKPVAVLVCFAQVAAAGNLSFHDYIQKRFHPETVQERDVEGLDQRIQDGKLVLDLRSFLALVLKKAPEDLIAVLGRVSSWPEIVADLDSLTETEVEQDGKRFIIRSAPRAAASLAVRATGVALPPTIRQAD